MTESSTPHIVLYTTPDCPDCHALRLWLSQNGVAYEERDLTGPKNAEPDAGPCPDVPTATPRTRNVQ